MKERWERPHVLFLRRQGGWCWVCLDIRHVLPCGSAGYPDAGDANTAARLHLARDMDHAEDRQAPTRRLGDSGPLRKAVANASAESFWPYEVEEGHGGR